MKTFDYGETLEFKAALKAHSMMHEPTQKLKNERGKKEWRGLCEQIWSELAGLLQDLDPEEKGLLAESIDITIPIETKMLVRKVDGTATAFAYCEVLKALVGVDLQDDLAIRTALKTAWTEFQNRRDEANDIEDGFGCDDSPSWHTLRDIADEPDSETFRQKMLEIAKLAGRMLESFGYCKRRTPDDSPMEVEGATTGGDVERLMGSEIAAMSDAVTEDAATMKVLKKAALQRDMKGERTQTRGPLVMAIDESGSMHDEYENFRGRNTWAKACAIALTRIAWAEGRPVRVVHFGTSTVCQEIPKDDMRALFEMARSFMDGGTDIGSSLDRARGMVGDLEAEGYKGADIVCITDGVDYDHKHHNRRLDQLDADGIRLWTVCIGDDIAEDHPLRARAEKYVFAHDRQLNNYSTATDLTDGLQDSAKGNDDN